VIEFKKYKKIAQTQARLLTSQDYEERHGLIHAPEGILKFTPGDYVAKDAKGEWPIRQATMRERVEYSLALYRHMADSLSSTHPART
jgi:hypothetical protein